MIDQIEFMDQCIAKAKREEQHQAWIAFHGGIPDQGGDAHEPTFADKRPALYVMLGSAALTDAMLGSAALTSLIALMCLFLVVSVAGI